MLPNKMSTHEQYTTSKRGYFIVGAKVIFQFFFFRILTELLCVLCCELCCVLCRMSVELRLLLYRCVPDI